MKVKHSKAKKPSGGKTEAPSKVWFDGVDKKLIEADAKRQATLNQANLNKKAVSSKRMTDHMLITKTPLPCLQTDVEEVNKHTSIKGIDGSTNLKDQIINGKKKNKPRSDKNLTHSKIIKPTKGLTDELAIDCEMVECYHHKSVLARVSIVNLFGHKILDRYVAPPSQVTDYRTRWSGIRHKDIANAPDFKTIQQEVADIIRGRIVVGHAVQNDFAVLKLSHPPELIRDTSYHYRYLFHGQIPSLKRLSENVLGIKIQKGEHDSVQDAQATMKLYVREREKWDENPSRGSHQPVSKVNPDRKTQKTKRKRAKTKPQSKKIKTFYVMTT